MSDKNNNSNGKGPDKNNGQSGLPQFMLVVLAACAALLLYYGFSTITSTTNVEVTYDEFITLVEDGEVESVVIGSSQITFVPTSEGIDALIKSGEYTDKSLNSNSTYYTGAITDLDLQDVLQEAGVEYSSIVPTSGSYLINLLFSYVVPIVLLWVLLGFLFNKISKSSGGVFGVGKSNAKIYVQKETGVTFKDVAGEDEAKESLVEVVDFLHNPEKYSGIGAKLPKGALLVGPPGTGKTLLAKAVAGEAHVPFYSLAGSDFIELYVGVGASRVRDLFAEANKNAPCIIFIDEIDAIGRSRDSKFGGGNEEREQTLNQLLSEMDGFDSSKGVLILGATNRPEILDKALLRPGRFDRRIVVDKPDLKGRIEILKVHSKDVKMDESVNLEEIALATSGAVGSDLANMINEAAINAVKARRQYVSQKDLMDAVEQVLVGKEKKDRLLSKEERKLVSYHEVGHALISAVQKNTEPVQKITIVPRTMGALGYVMQVPEEEKYLSTKEEMRQDIVVALGGRAAEEVVFNTVTTGAENDIEKATELARDMITMYGMSDKFGLMQLESVQNRYLDGRKEMNCSDKTAYEVDVEIKNLLASCYEEAKDIIRNHLDAMDKLAEHLISKETISGKEFMQIYREIENIPEPTEEEKNKRLRIYATRPESAKIGEDVPTADDTKANDAKKQMENMINSWTKEEDKGQNFEAVIQGYSYKENRGISNGDDADKDYDPIDVLSGKSKSLPPTDDEQADGDKVGRFSHSSFEDDKKDDDWL